MSINREPMVSVIVPVYKVEEYLTECVNSVLSQTFTDFELILVDDGSPDKCGLICDEYALKDKRVHVIHKENGGLSDARNKGIDAAIGKYITFIDSDDFIVNSYIEDLVKCIEDTDADMVQGNHSSNAEDLGNFFPDRLGKMFSLKEFSTRQAVTDFLLYHTQYANVWAKIYKKRLFDEIRFPVGKLTEDEYTTYQLILSASKVVCIPKVIYYYRKRKGSIVTSYSDKRFDVCEEVPDLLRTALSDANMLNEKELDYKCVRIWLKIYNDFIQGGVYSQYRNQLDNLKHKICNTNIDLKVWERKYILIYFALKYAPTLYRKTVYKHRGE